MGKRTIKNEVSTRDAEVNQVKRFTTSGKSAKKMRKNWKLKMASIGLAAGLGAVTPSIITNIAQNINETNSTKQAIEMAVSTDKYIENIKSNQTLQITFSDDNIMKMQNLKSAINDYKELKYKKDKTYGEEQRFLDSCRTIGESKSLVIEAYTNTIRAKVAEAYGITDSEEISKIKIGDYIEVGTNGEFAHNPQIEMPDGTCIVKASFFNPNKTMDSTLGKNIIDARALLDEQDFSEDSKIDELPIEKIIKTFEETKKFEKNYKLILDQKGNIKTQNIEQAKETDDRTK